MNRLNLLPTLRVDPSQKRFFSYRGKTLWGLSGDTVATALFSNGVRVFGRSLKYRRPRGLYSLDGECGNTCMKVDDVPNVHTETTLLKNAMRVEAQNVAGAPEWDVTGFMDMLSVFMPAGIYYRCMHKPPALWPAAVKIIRKAAGWGTIGPAFAVPGTYDEIYPAAEVCIIGGGPAGMRAALAAAESGLRVIVLERRPRMGGFFEYRVAADNKGKKAYQRAKELADRVHRAENIRVFLNAALLGVYSNTLITARQIGGDHDSFTERYMEINAQSTVVATGCIERPLLFEHNERPGVMQVGCAHRLARTYGLLPGKEAVFSVGHDLGLEAAVDLADLGLQIRGVADIRKKGQDPVLVQALSRRNIPFYKGWAAVRAHGARHVTGVTLSRVEGGGKRRFGCDLLVASAGLTPVNGPLAMTQTQMTYDPHTGYFLPSAMPANMFCAGRMTGLYHPQSIEASGRLAGVQAAARVTGDWYAVAEAQRALAATPGAESGCKLIKAPAAGRKTFVCFDEDATVKNVKQAIDEGFDVPELVKRYAAVGLGPSQGGIPGHNLPLLVAKYTAPSNVPRPTTMRPPLIPTSLATYAGVNHRLLKRTPVHDSQKSAGAILRTMGQWRRARYFTDDFTCKEEILNVRNNVGMLDASTLGKFRIHGPDALKVLQRVYVSDMRRVKKGRVKYSAMCNDDGCVIDDGVVVKQGENDYYFTTSTARAEQTEEWIRHCTRFDNWEFYLVNLTDAMGVIHLSGPNARKVLEKVVDGDISNTAFPFAAYREFYIEKIIPVRAMRLGFVGELSYELHVPASYMQWVWDQVASAGMPYGIRNFGVEAQNVLRMEKGHIILGQESEQRTNLLDLGLGFLWDRTKKEAKTIGAVALHQAEADASRLKLVGIQMEDDARPAKDGALVVDHRIRGYVCTARKSVSTGKCVGMALVESPLAGLGTRLTLFEDESQGRRLYARVAAMPFYDPEGRRMKM